MSFLPQTRPENNFDIDTPIFLFHKRRENDALRLYKRRSRESMPLDVREQIEICKAARFEIEPGDFAFRVQMFEMMSRSRKGVYLICIDINMMEPETR